MPSPGLAKVSLVLLGFFAAAYFAKKSYQEPVKNQDANQPESALYRTRAMMFAEQERMSLLPRAIHYVGSEHA